MTDTATRPSRWLRFIYAIWRRRYRWLAVADALMWVVALPAATFARQEFAIRSVNVGDLGIALAIVITVHVAAGIATGLYLGRHRLASFDEVRWVAITALIPVAVLLLVLLISPGENLVPQSAILAGAAYQVVGALAVRYVLRVLVEQRRISAHPRKGRLLIFGAGDAGYQAMRLLRDDTTSEYLPVAFLDDDPGRARLRVGGLPIVGGRDAIGDAARQFDAEALLIAIPSAQHSDAMEVADLGQQAGLEVRILPPMDKFLTEPVEARDIRSVTLADFLSRDEVHLDLEQIAEYLQGKRVMITGAGGSIGGQICEAVAGFRPETMAMVDHNENGLAALQLRLEGRALLEDPSLVLADIRDRDGMRRIMERHRPDVVFHAAAHKHVTFLERFPREGLLTNVFGTRNVLDAAAEAGVERFVNVSTDKAADPVNVLGLTKRLGEMLTSHVGAALGRPYISVRFGNVLGSQGSVIPIFREQLERGEKLTVTDPGVTRYFMTLEEAVQLVVQAGAVGDGGDVLVLDMGEPIPILELARRLAAEITPGRAPEIEFTGLRPGEKLHETLVSDDDADRGRPHELLLRYRVPAIGHDAPDPLLEITDPAALVEAMRRLVSSVRLPS
ncbi:MAG: polysaccharide biosynthesis protein [Actinobacteria bacterium]|nr:polysaccharide biosynthesis protein [Actinomycetota bacterium]